jgi:hypothetical protein
VLCWLCDGFSLPITVPPKGTEEAPSPRRGFFFSGLTVLRGGFGDLFFAVPALLGV